jgi:Na+-transporting methylmalonyl-CoA/oxaloacetate decarboxylase beta subunit
MLDILADFYKSTGVTELFRFDTELFGVMIPGKLIMVVIALIFIYLAVKKGYEPYLLIPIAFGMLLANLPLAGLMDGPLGNQPGGLSSCQAVLVVFHQASPYPPLSFKL